MNTSVRGTLVLVHGIWMTGLEMGWLGRRLSDQGFDVRYFRYHSLGMTPRENARKLFEFIQSLGQEPLHLVGHSLGGVVLLHLLDAHRDLPQGRVVLLGSPVRGSRVARVMSGNPFLRPFLGRSMEQGLSGELPSWQGGRQLGVIAGTGGFGVGRLLGGVSGPNDGTVSVDETNLDGAVDSCCIKTSHMGMLFSAAVAEQITQFLETGRFSSC
ncbi:MAG: alpha/beta hydrolase [Candidatus Sedimenticola sp. 6PFRAG1]